MLFNKIAMHFVFVGVIKGLSGSVGSLAAGINELNNL
jgi:hypothetical protein